MIIDIGNGTNSNYNAIQAATRYFSTSLVLEHVLVQGRETRAAISKAKSIVNSVVLKILILLTASKRFAVETDNLTGNTFQVAVGVNPLFHICFLGGTVTFGVNTFNIPRSQL